MNVRFCAMALASFAVATCGVTAVGADPDGASPGAVGRFVEGTKDFFRSPFKRGAPPSPPASQQRTVSQQPTGKDSPSGVQRASYTSQPQAAARAAPAKPARQHPRTLTEFMAEERP
jgi:hypothetical protein